MKLINMQGFWNDWNNGDDKQYNNNIPKWIA